MSPENGKIFDSIWSEGARAKPRMSFSEALSAFADAVRAEERARAIEVVKPFAENLHHTFDGCSDSRMVEVRPSNSGAHWSHLKARVGDFRRAAAYVSDNQSKGG